MRICFLTLFTPTSENRGGPTALPYYLLKYRSSSISIHMLTCNLNDISEKELQQIADDLEVTYEVMHIHSWYKLAKRNHQTKIRVLFKYPIFTYVYSKRQVAKRLEELNPDVIWQYPDTFFEMLDVLPDKIHVVTGPDCSALTNLRGSLDPFSWSSAVRFWWNAKQVYSNLLLDRKGVRKNVLYHVVGMEDYRYIKRIAPKKNVFFLLHPHYSLVNSPIVDLHKPKLKVLIAGQMKQQLLLGTGVKDLMDSLSFLPESLKERFCFTFLGKGWESYNEQLQMQGYTSEHIKWVEDYVETIACFDIQIAPISVGAGTKGKILDAIGNGVLVIGTTYALENIAVRTMHSCVHYRTANEIPSILLSIANHPDRYEKIARQGVYQVRTYHAPKRIAQRFFGIIEHFCLDS